MQSTKECFHYKLAKRIRIHFDIILLEKYPDIIIYDHLHIEQEVTGAGNYAYPQPKDAVCQVPSP